MIAQVVLADAALSNGKLRRAILRYYRRHGRRLPWRGERDPYRVWVSEVMLQQTQVLTVVKRYRSFIQRFPNIRALASAPVAQVYETWAGLGYYARARNLHKAAGIVVARHGGHLPTEMAELQALPGVGRYTAGAVASIGFGKTVPVVDGNVTRFLTRLFAVEESPARAAGARRLWSIAGELVARTAAPGEINQALMELGACVCTPRAPRCGHCPARPWCVARALGTQGTFPRRSAVRSERPVLRVALAWLEDSRGLWLERRPEVGLWAGQWQLPAEEGPRARMRLAERLGVGLEHKLATIEHPLTHRQVQATVFDGGPARGLRTRQDFRRFAKPSAAPVSGLARRAIVAVLSQRPPH